MNKNCISLDERAQSKENHIYVIIQMEQWVCTVYSFIQWCFFDQQCETLPVSYLGRDSFKASKKQNVQQPSEVTGGCQNWHATMVIRQLKKQVANAYTVPFQGSQPQVMLEGQYLCVERLSARVCFLSTPMNLTGDLIPPRRVHLGKNEGVHFCSLQQLGTSTRIL